MWRLKRSLHSSWQIAVASVALFGGVVWAGLTDITLFTGLGWLLAGTALVISACVWQKVWLATLAIVGGFLIGAWRGGGENESLNAYRAIIGHELTVTGTMSDDMDVDKNDNKVLRLKNIVIDEYALPGQLWVTVKTTSDIKRSDNVVVRGTLSSGFGSFQASIYRAEIFRIEQPVPGDRALQARDWFASQVRAAVPDPQASLGIGYLVGQRRNLPESLDTALQIAGLTHIVVASGYNLTILVRLSRRLFMKISKFTAAAASSGLVVSFVAITGMSPSMSRAGLIAGLSLLAWYYGRKFHPLVLLSFAVAVTVLVNPSYAWSDVGWQLSFAAFGGVMILAPLLQAFYFGPKKPGIIRQILGETFAASICTLPILLLYFGQISNVAIIANALILPLVPLAMLLTFIAGLGAFALPIAAQVIGFPAYILLTYMTETATRLASIPWAVSEIEITPIHGLMMYGAITAGAVYMWWRTKLNLRDANLIE